MALVQFNSKLRFTHFSTIFSRRFISTSVILKKQECMKADNEDKPIKFSTSNARSYKAFDSLKERDENTRLWYEPYVIMGSLAVFLIYFTVLREENDIDEELMVPLHKRIEGLEERQLRTFIEYDSGNRVELAQARQRLKEIELEKRENDKN